MWQMLCTAPSKLQLLSHGHMCPAHVHVHGLGLSYIEAEAGVVWLFQGQSRRVVVARAVEGQAVYRDVDLMACARLLVCDLKVRVQPGSVSRCVAKCRG